MAVASEAEGSAPDRTPEPEPFDFHAFLSKRERMLELRLQIATSRAQLDDLELYIDGMEREERGLRTELRNIAEALP